MAGEPRTSLRFRAPVALLAALTFLASAGCGRGQQPDLDGVEAASVPATTTSTLPPPVDTTVATTTPPPPTTAAPAPAPPASPATVAVRPAASSPPRPLLPGDAVDASLEPYRGLGTWVDVYDWSHYKGTTPTVGPAQIDEMAAAGVQTLFLQTAKHDAPDGVLEPDLLLPIISRAKQLGIEVVAWYLPTLEDPGNDLRRLVASAALDVDGIAVDIEARNVPDVAERNRRLIDLSSALRELLPGRAIGGIVLPPVLLEDVNPNYWPSFPWQQIAPYYDVWQTMGYWSDRTFHSGHRDAYAYTLDNQRRLRANLGRPDAIVHPVGGIGDKTGDADLIGFNRAVGEAGSIGGSIYDWRTTHPDRWARLRELRVADR